MNFTPNDLQNMVFKKSVFGYSEDRVNEVLDRIIEDYTIYIKENMEIREKMETINEKLKHYKNIENALRESLLVAQRTGDEVKKNAHEKADNIIKEAEMKAERIIDEAREDVQKMKREYEDIRGQFKVYRSKSESLIHSQLELLRQLNE